MGDWVRDQGAIDTIIALGELKPGDEVELVGCEHYHLARAFRDGDVVRLKDWESGTSLVGDIPEHFRTRWATEPIIARIDSQREGMWVICRKNIAAWRRP